jgi:hypothetical protein
VFLEFETLNKVDWFNNRRLTERIGNTRLAEAEKRYYAILDEQRLAACLKPRSLRRTPSGSLPPISQNTDGDTTRT